MKIASSINYYCLINTKNIMLSAIDYLELGGKA